MLEDFGISDWSDVIGGVFLPPITGKRTTVPQTIRSRRPPRNSELYNAIIPVDRFRYDPVTRTYKSTIGRLLRESVFGVLITLRDEAITFEFERTARRGLDWLSMHYRSIKPSDLRMVIVNNDFAYQPNPDEDAGVRVIRDGIYFVAKFKYTKANRTLVEQSGFEFSPTVKWWFTLDPEIAVKLEVMIKNGAGIAAHTRPANAADTAESRGARLSNHGSPTTTARPRRQAPAWVRRRAASRRQLSLKLGDTRKPIIRTWK